MVPGFGSVCMPGISNYIHAFKAYHSDYNPFFIGSETWNFRLYSHCISFVHGDFGNTLWNISYHIESRLDELDVDEKLLHFLLLLLLGEFTSDVNPEKRIGNYYIDKDDSH